jgi:hypothetical protein
VFMEVYIEEASIIENELKKEKAKARLFDA